MKWMRLTTAIFLAAFGSTASEEAELLNGSDEWDWDSSSAAGIVKLPRRRAITSLAEATPDPAPPHIVNRELRKRRRKHAKTPKSPKTPKSKSKRKSFSRSNILDKTCSTVKNYRAYDGLCGVWNTTFSPLDDFNFTLEGLGLANITDPCLYNTTAVPLPVAQDAPNGTSCSLSEQNCTNPFNYFFCEVNYLSGQPGISDPMSGDSQCWQNTGDADDSFATCTGAECCAKVCANMKYNLGLGCEGFSIFQFQGSSGASVAGVYTCTFLKDTDCGFGGDQINGAGVANYTDSTCYANS